MYMKIKQYSVEQDVSSLKNSLSEAKIIYESMESEYHSALDCGLVDSDSSLAKTFNDATKAYLDSIKPAMKILKDSGMDTVVSAPVSLSDVHVSSAQSQFSVSSELANALTLPKITIPTFAGNPAEYKLFISLFDEAVAAKVNDSRSKLTYLSTFVKGEALQAIRPMLAEFHPVVLWQSQEGATGKVWWSLLNYTSASSGSYSGQKGHRGSWLATALRWVVGSIVCPWYRPKVIRSWFTELLSGGPYSLPCICKESMVQKGSGN